MGLSPSTSAPDPRGRRLLELARAAILRGSADDAYPREAWLAAPGATFVTLKLDGELRGCIGSLEARRSLAEDVVRNALAAAYRDPRFPPVTVAERERLQIEVSLLAPALPLAATSEAEALRLLRPGIDGVVLEYGECRSTFLPQVWESLPVPRDFLGELKRKAGLPRDFWDPAIRLSRYAVEKFA